MFARATSRTISLAMVLCFLAAASQALEPRRESVLPEAIEPAEGGEYYTRHNLWYEEGRSYTTNYSRGALLPINSLVTLVAVDRKKIIIRTEHGEQIDLRWVKKHSIRRTDEIAAEFLGDRPVPIERLGEELAASIANGELRLGMTKEQVLMTRGYPPRHRTPSTGANTWIYWDNRFVNRTLVFRDDVLTEGRGLR